MYIYIYIYIYTHKYEPASKSIVSASLVIRLRRSLLFCSACNLKRTGTNDALLQRWTTQYRTCGIAGCGLGIGPLETFAALFGGNGAFGFCISIRGRVASCSLQELVSECMRGFCDVEGPGWAWGFKLLGFRDVWSLQLFICIYTCIYIYIYLYIYIYIYV